MRAESDKLFLSSRFEESYSIDNFLSKDEVLELIKLYYSLNDADKTFKNTGPVTSSIIDNPSAKTIFNKLQQKVFDEVGECIIYNASFFKVSVPHIIHNDDLKELPLIYKAFTLPLEITGNASAYPEFITFKQHYLNGPAKFFNGGTDLPIFYNEPVTEYSNVLGLDPMGVSFNDRKKYFSHVKKEWLNGLTIEKVFPWIPGNAIVFDCPRLHAASDFRTKGITSKLGLSIFTYTERQ